MGSCQSEYTVQVDPQTAPGPREDGPNNNQERKSPPPGPAATRTERRPISRGADIADTVHEQGSGASPPQSTTEPAVNSFVADMDLPSLPARHNPADSPVLRSKGNSKWPIGCFVPIGLNVNSGYGGCAGLLLMSNMYNKNGGDCTMEMGFLWTGFDSNHYGVISITSNYGGHFHPEYRFATNEEGDLLPNLMFGTNHVTLLTNDARNGHLGFGVAVESESESFVLPLYANGNHSGGQGGGSTLIMCSASDNDTTHSAIYGITCGPNDAFVKANLITGDDLWKIGAKEEIYVGVDGPENSRYGIYHNRTNLPSEDEVQGHVQGKVIMTQCLDGNEAKPLLSEIPQHAVAFVLCSNSCGAENNTASALYAVTLSRKEGGEAEVKAAFIKGAAGPLYSSADVWTFEVNNTLLVVKGPAGPCKYALFSNLAEDEPEPKNRCSQDFCLATGELEPVQGVCRIEEKMVTGWVSKPCRISVTINEETAALYSANQLVEQQGKWAFCREWTEKEQTNGLKLIRVHALMEKVQGGHAVQMLELVGSPKQLVYQKEGVAYALNCGGPAYEATNGIVYTSEHHQFVNKKGYEYGFGTRYTTFGDVSHLAQIPQLLTRTQDGFMYAAGRIGGAEAVDEQKAIYKVAGIPNGQYTLRLHMVAEPYPNAVLKCQGKTYKFASLVKAAKFKPDLQGYTCFYLEIPKLEIREEMLDVYYKDHTIAGISLHTENYKEKSQSEEEKREEDGLKQKLSQKVEPLVRVTLKKELKIMGWSQNLLKNSSGESGDMSCWNSSGTWKTAEGGQGTERCFVTSHMWCTKDQEVDLLENFSREYLDTAPPIQVYEWYREGCCGGGHYKFQASILSEQQQVLKNYDFATPGTFYKNNAWFKEGTTFSDYGPGARWVRLSSSGKDDKHWGGHYGPMISNCNIRVKRESTSAPGDEFQDIKQVLSGESDVRNKANSAAREKLITHILAENQELLKGLTEENVLPEVDATFQKQREIAQTSKMVPKTKKQKKKKREIRVFVSSTFRDFKNEREELIKKTFREINAICAERGVFFTYVDLRWGITEEQTNHGQTIAICLQEIERCRPYFLCMLGNRFGWSQQKDKPDSLLNQSFDYAIENHPHELGWVDKYRFGSSVTQLEVLHGVLNDVDSNKGRSFFYLREMPNKEELQEADLKVYNAESDWHDEKQQSLRKRVVSTPDLNKRNYSEALQVCGLIKQDLLWCIDEDFPKGTELTPLQREKEAHEAFAAARRRVYIGREESFAKIDEYMSVHHASPLVLLGESGSGKSALVANWAGRVEDKEPNIFLFVHFIGSSAESASYIKLLRRLYDELKNHFGFELAIPSTDTALVRELPQWLQMAGSQSKCVLVFDALNQLDDGMGTEEAEHDLLWIPRTLPANVYLLLSTLPGRALEAVKAADWPSQLVTPLDPADKAQIVTDYLEGIYGKTLSAEQKDMIISAEQTNNPLYLKALLDEVRMYGSFRLLTKKIEDYLHAATPGDLFAKILARLEEDFDHTRPGLVRETTVAIWCSQRGLSESELLDLLEVPSAIWSPFYLSLVENMVNRNGILNFFHDHLRQAVESRYLSTADDKLKGYARLADYFSEKTIDDRVVDELPLLLVRAKQLEKLRETISQLDMFSRMAATEETRFSLISAWKTLGDFSETEVYVGKLIAAQESGAYSLEEMSGLARTLGEFYLGLGLFDIAKTTFLRLLQQVENIYRDKHSTILYNFRTHSRKIRCNHPTVIDVLHNLGMVSEKQNELGEAERWYLDAIERQNRIHSPQHKLKLCEGLLGLATVYYLKENMKESQKLLVRCRELATDVLGSRHHYVAAIINKLGQLCYKQARLDEALGYFLQDLNLTRGDVGSAHPRCAGVLNDIALVYDDRNDQVAGELYEAALIILLDTYGHSHMDVAILRYNLGAFYLATQYFSKAKYQYQEVYKIWSTFLGAEHPDTLHVKELCE